MTGFDAVEAQQHIEQAKREIHAAHHSIAPSTGYRLINHLELAVAEVTRLNARIANMTVLPLSRDNEPPVGTWVRDRFGGTSMRQRDGWGEPGIMPFGRWQAMWDARGPYEICGPWGKALSDSTEPESDPSEASYQAVCGSWDCRAPECRPKGI